jgi:predicted restriction endonuclease
MTPEELKQQIRQITVGKRGEQRAPHKPLLLSARSRCTINCSTAAPSRSATPCSAASPPKTNGLTGLSEWLTSFHGLPLKSPQSTRYLPLKEHLAWHRKEVFHGPGRELNAGP